jgi:hypothetical protein
MTKQFFVKEDFTPEIVKGLKKKGYTRYIPKRDLRQGDKELKETYKEMKTWYENDWNWWINSSGKIIPAFEMFSNP